MSYDIELVHPITGDILHLDEPHQLKGGTYAVGGTTEASLNVTYNYSQHFYAVLDDGIRSIYGMTGADSIPVLQAAADQLADNVHPNYWEATEGNAKAALLQLIALAKMRPDGVWQGD